MPTTYTPLGSRPNSRGWSRLLRVTLRIVWLTFCAVTPGLCGSGEAANSAAGSSTRLSVNTVPAGADTSTRTGWLPRNTPP